MNGPDLPIEIRVNDELCTAVAGQCLLDYLIGRGLEPAGVLIEWNGIALLRSEWEQTRLAAGDRLEILRIVAGG